MQNLTEKNFRAEMESHYLSVLGHTGTVKMIWADSPGLVASMSSRGINQVRNHPSQRITSTAFRFPAGAQEKKKPRFPARALESPSR